jgi:hypothetical protein
MEKSMTSLLQSPARDLLRDLQSVLGSVGTSPKAGSPADQEIRVFLRPESVKTALSQANTALEASADHLEALDSLVGEARYAVSPWTCARGVLEAVAIATWLLDSTIDVKERVSRSLVLRFSTLQEQRKMANAIDDSQKVQDIEERIDSIEAMTIQLGYSPLRDSRGRRTGIGQVKPSMTDLVQQQFDFGNLYRVLSGIAHSDSVVVSQLGFMKTGALTPDGVVAQRAVPKEIQSMLLANAVAIHTRGVWLRVILYGCDAAETAVILERRYDQLDLADTDVVRFWRSTVGMIGRRDREEKRLETSGTVTDVVCVYHQPLRGAEDGRAPGRGSGVRRTPSSPQRQWPQGHPMRRRRRGRRCPLAGATGCPHVAPHAAVPG